MPDVDTRFETHKKIFFGGVIVFVLVLIIAVISVVVRSVRSAKIEVFVSPKIATVRIGDRKFNAEHRTYTFAPGEYKVTASADGFVATESTVTAVKDKTVILRLVLEPTADNADYYSKNPDEAERRFQVEDALIVKEEARAMTDPIYKVTPFHSYDLGFFIDALSSDQRKNGKIVVRIRPQSCIPSNADALTENAREWLKKKGIKLEDYEIEQVDECHTGTQR